MTEFQFTPQTQLIDPQTGRLTREGFLLLNNINTAVSDVTSEFVKVDATQTLTNKTIDGDNNTLSDIATASLKARTGQDTNVATGTAGTNGNFASWNADGDLVGSGKAAPTGDVVGTTDTQALTNKTLTDPNITLPSFTVAGVPAAASNARRLIYVSDETGGPTVAFSDGTNWLRVQDRAIVS